MTVSAVKYLFAGVGQFAGQTGRALDLVNPATGSVDAPSQVMVDTAAALSEGECGRAML